MVIFFIWTKKKHLWKRLLEELCFSVIKLGVKFFLSWLLTDVVINRERITIILVLWKEKKTLEGRFFYGSLRANLFVYLTKIMECVLSLVQVNHWCHWDYFCHYNQVSMTHERNYVVIKTSLRTYYCVFSFVILCNNRKFEKKYSVGRIYSIG